MYSLYNKNEKIFSFVLIFIYVLSFSIAENVSFSIGIEKAITLPVLLLLTILILGFVIKHNLNEKYGLCSFKGNIKNYLFFIPLVFIMSSNLWNGVTMNMPIFETILYIFSMVFVGFVEEMIFRGFLFKALCKRNVKMAIIVSSLTFGLGHIANLANGQDLIPTLLQIAYAIAIGFLFTIIFYKGKSLWPCIIAHIFINTSSVFAIEFSSINLEIILSVVFSFIAILYTVWILKIDNQVTNNEVEEI